MQNAWVIKHCSAYFRAWRQARNFFRKGQNKTEKDQNIQKHKKIGKRFTIFEKGTLMDATIACMKCLKMTCTV